MRIPDKNLAEIWDRGFGKSPASLDVDLAVRRQILTMSAEELAELDAKLAAASTLPAIAYESDEQPSLLECDGGVPVTSEMVERALRVYCAYPAEATDKTHVPPYSSWIISARKPSVFTKKTRIGRV